MNFELRYSIWDVCPLHDREADPTEVVNIANGPDSQDHLSDLRRWRPLYARDHRQHGTSAEVRPCHPAEHAAEENGIRDAGVGDLLTTLFVTHQFLETR